MSLLLNIDTAIDTASVSIAKEGIILQQAFSYNQKDYAAFLQPAIQSIVKNAGLALHQIDAIAVVAGPGSYTGLRVGMATAKGLCFALNKPLITVGTLEVLAYQSINKLSNLNNNEPALFCAMVDARRMEVFTAVYNAGLDIILEPSAVIIEEKSFANLLLKNKIAFFGNGAAKWQQMCNHKNAYFFQLENNALFMSELSFKKYLNHQFADMAYAVPMYVKEFYNGAL